MRIHGKPGLIAVAVLYGAWFSGLAGCGAKVDSFTPVQGTVTVNGAPLAKGSVTFHPDSARGNSTPHIPVGTLDAEGRYKLMSATKEGAPLGWYKVTVTAQEPIDPKNPYAAPKHLISPKFSDVSTSGLAIEVVKQAASDAYDIKLAP
jgi:hypothetical protein